jgi:hypothetical protein
LKNPSEALNIQERRTRVPWPELTVALISGLIFVVAHFQALTNPLIINDDVRQQLYWMQQWQDPALFRGDFLTGYARHYVPWGVKGLYWAASSWAATARRLSRLRWGTFSSWVWEPYWWPPCISGSAPTATGPW